MYNRLFIFLSFCFLSLGSFSQTPDTAILLPSVEIAAEALRSRLPGGRIETWDGQVLQSLHLGDLLNRQSGVFVKSYGLGSSATTSIRGGSAGHSLVLWNGLPIQSPMLGQLDFSLMPLAFADAVQLQYGGNSAAWGSGAIGGTIGLDNQPDFSNKPALQFRATLGDFGFSEQQAKAAFGNERWLSVTRLFRQGAKNDFPFRPAPGLPEQRLTNGSVRQTGVLQELYWRASPRSQLALRLWAQEAQREIPPTLTQTRSLASQDDAFLRTALHWKWVGKRLVWQARGGLFREKLDYRDGLIGLESITRTTTAIAEAEGEWFLNERQRLQFGLGHTWMQARAGAFEFSPQQHRTAPFAAFRQKAGRWQFQLNLRQEIVDGSLAPLVPGFGMEGALTPWLDLHAKISRNYRLPTFNDLYWQPGGNPDLLPESGWSQEAGLRFHLGQWSYSFTGFNRRIDNWILWSPNPGQFFWSPKNIARVWSRGLEQRLNWTLARAHWKLQLSGGYDFIRSTNQKAVQIPRIEAGAQLIYTPLHQAFGRIAFQWRGLEAEYNHQYTGPVSGINVSELPGYNLGFFSLAYGFELKRWAPRFFLEINNAWNTEYQVVERRPMPGPYGRIGIQILLKH